MKCSVTECKTTAKKVGTLGWIALEKELTKCNRCFFSQEPSRRYDPGNPAYRTRNEVGATYAKAWFRK